MLRFFAYFKQTVHESPAEYFRVRPVDIYYYLEDDSISVVEPHVENSGMPQGTVYLYICVTLSCLIKAFNPVIMMVVNFLKPLDKREINKQNIFVTI